MRADNDAVVVSNNVDDSFSAEYALCFDTNISKIDKGSQ